MVKIKYSRELLQDFHNLVRDFAHFMITNLIHADADVDPAHKAEMQAFIKYSLKMGKPIAGFFETPLFTHEAKNKDKLIKNFEIIMKKLKEYLAYGEAYLGKLYPHLFNDRFAAIKRHYEDFIAKYGISA